MKGSPAIWRILIAVVACLGPALQYGLMVHDETLVSAAVKSVEPAPKATPLRDHPPYNAEWEARYAADLGRAERQADPKATDAIVDTHTIYCTGGMPRLVATPRCERCARAPTTGPGTRSLGAAAWSCRRGHPSTVASACPMATSNRPSSKSTSASHARENAD